MNINFATTGAQTAVFLVRSANPLDGQRSYSVGPARSLLGTWTPGVAPYDLTVSGRNGFVRRFAGNMLLGGTRYSEEGLTVQEIYSKGANVVSITMTNGNAAAVSVVVTDGYTGAMQTRSIAPGASTGLAFKLTAMHGWSDLRVTLPYYPSFGVQLAGHLETGADSSTDPMIS